MILISNTNSSVSEFEAILEIAKDYILEKYKDKTNELRGIKFEPIVKNAIELAAINSRFDGSIELVGGLRFPDISVNGYFGVEVKTTTKDHWITTGNSVLESTRLDGIERIYLFFAQIEGKLNIKIRPYHECLSEVVVTHSPRYLIDMNLMKGESIFDKMRLQYDDVRKNNPIGQILNYYRTTKSKGDGVWWLDSPEGQPSKIVTKFWNSLSKDEKQAIRLEAIVLFPEIFSLSQYRFAKFTFWLFQNKGVICPNVRDIFTAGGQFEIVINSEPIFLPHIYGVLLNNVNEILKIINLIQVQILELTWERKVENKLNDWTEIFLSNCLLSQAIKNHIADAFLNNRQ